MISGRSTLIFFEERNYLKVLLCKIEMCIVPHCDRFVYLMYHYNVESLKRSSIFFIKCLQEYGIDTKRIRGQLPY